MGQIATPLISIFWIISDLVVSKLISTNEDTIPGFSGGKVINKANIVDKEFETRFLTSEARLAFTKSKQAFSRTLIIHYFDLKYDIMINTNVLGYVINGIFSQLTMDDSDR